jgi:hypothetical protein
MTLRPEFALGHSEFNAFLFAPVGEDKTGFPLTVLSALARLGLDPWGEAARLSNLSVEAAVQALSATIARLPEGDWKASDTAGIAARLVACLPRRGALPIPPAPTLQGLKAKLTLATRTGFSNRTGPSNKTGSSKRPGPAIWLLCLAVAVGWYMLVSHLTANAPLESVTSSSTQQ